MEKPLSAHWFYGFLSRWPELKVQKPRSLEIQRAKATSPDTVSHYYHNLERILDKYDLKMSPERIYNVDEKGIMQNHTPPSIVGPSGDAPVAITLSRSSTTTVIGSGNAMGNFIPPYFVFKGKRMRDELLEGCSPGTNGTVSDSGWSNTVIFKKYLSDHFLKYCTPPTAEKPVLILYDGHKSHVSVSLSEWARERHIVLFVLPAHTSHILQPMDVGCFGPYEKIYCNLRHKFMRENATQGIDKYSICRLGCQAYITALTPSNLQSSFRKCGIYPFNRNAIDKSKFTPSVIFQESSDAIPSTAISTSNSQTDISAHSSSNSISPTPIPPTSATPVTSVSTAAKENGATFFSNIDQSLSCKTKSTVKRKLMSTIVGGKAITDCDILKKMKEHEKSHPPRPTKQQKLALPEPSTSGIKPMQTNTNFINESDSETLEEDKEVCCKCKMWQPVEVRDCVSLVFVSWAQCTHQNCDHWVHLKFCTPVRCVRRNAEFWCPCHLTE